MGDALWAPQTGRPIAQPIAQRTGAAARPTHGPLDTRQHMSLVGLSLVHMSLVASFWPTRQGLECHVGLEAL
jgi:hypothetical protein